MLSHSTSLGIVVGVDGSPASKVAVDWAAREASLRDIPLTVVHAAPAVSARRRASRIIDDAIRIARDRPKGGAAPRLSTAVMPTEPVEALVEMSRNAEMVVVGSRRRSTWRRAWSSSVSVPVVRESHCPVAVIHDEDPLMPHPAHAPVLASEQAIRFARQEAARRNVELVISEESAARLVEQSETAQLVVVDDQLGTTVAQRARMPVLVAR